MAMKSEFEHADWQERTLLILGSTYPNHSKKYVEVACTGAIDESTGRMIRIHPMPRRQLEPENRFQDFQRVRARIKRNFEDGRVDSMRIDPPSITPLEVIPPASHEARRNYIERCPNLVGSVEELFDRLKTDGMSLGIVRPKELVRVYLKQRSAKDVAAWHEKEDDLLRQQTMAGEKPPRPLDCPVVDFHVSWRCDDARCKTHDMTVKTWGLHELYRKLEGDARRDEKVKAKMLQTFDLAKRDVFMFFGTFVGRRFEFGLMGAYAPERLVQMSLGLDR